jgi:hypothetical protein
MSHLFFVKIPKLRMGSTRTGSLELTPGRNDAWKTAHGRLYADWSVRLSYGISKGVVACQLAKNCSFIRCPIYTYSRLPD